MTPASITWQSELAYREQNLTPLPYSQAKLTQTYVPGPLVQVVEVQVVEVQVGCTRHTIEVR